MKKTFLSILVFALLAVSAHADSVSIAWDPSPTPGVSYRIYQSVGAITNPFSVARETGTANSATLLVTVPTRFYVTAFNANGESIASNIITYTPLAPAPPTNLRATVLSASRIDLRWDPFTMSSVIVERDESPIALIYGRSYYLDTGLRKNRLYSYRIRGSDTGYSNTATAQTFRR